MSIPGWLSGTVEFSILGLPGFCYGFEVLAYEDG
jgi:hypothetical protein